jgi:hypothetical protein
MTFRVKQSITNKTNKEQRTKNKEQQTEPDLHKTKKKLEKQISGSESN